MIGLDRLMEIPGVIAAGQFSADGKAIRKEGEFSEEVMASISRTCADNNSIMETEVEKMSEETGLNCAPLNGWMIWGGKYSIFVVNNTGVIIETKKADFNQLMVDLFGSGPTGPRLMPS